MRLLILTIFSFVFLTFPHATAQTQQATQSVIETGNSTQKYKYELPSIEKFSQLYWAIGALNLENNTDIDNFIKINQCDLYKKFFINEFEWNSIRQSTKEFIKTSASTFPTRFQILQPMKLGEYNFEKKAFEVAEEFKIKGVSRYEIRIDDPYADICTQKGNLQGYPPSLVAQLNRPINLEYVPMAEDKAKKFINEKQQRVGSVTDQKGLAVAAYRDVYMVLKLKIFGFKKFDYFKDGMMGYAEVLTVVEGMDIYSDRELKNPILQEDYLKRRNISQTEMRLRKEREAKKRAQDAKKNVPLAKTAPASP